MDIKNSEEKIKDIDSLLTTLTKVLKKHWFILTIISIGALGYFICTAEVPAESEVEYVEEELLPLDDSSAYYYEDAEGIYQDEE